MCFLLFFQFKNFRNAFCPCTIPCFASSPDSINFTAAMMSLAPIPNSYKLKALLYWEECFLKIYILLKMARRYYYKIIVHELLKYQ